MSLLSNPNPIRLGKYQSWVSPWYENNLVYSSLIYTDLYVNEFLNGIYYKLKIPTSIPMIRELGYEQLMISLKSFISFHKRRSRLELGLQYLNIIKVKHRKILFFFRRVLKNNKKNKYYLLNILNNTKKHYLKNIYFSNFLISNNNIIDIKNKKRNINIKKINFLISNRNYLKIKKNKYFFLLKQLYYNIFNKRKVQYKIDINIKKYIRNNIKYFLQRKKKKLNINIKRKKKNIYKYKNKKKLNIFKYKKYQFKKNRLYKKMFYKSKKKTRLFLYKLKFRKNRRYRFKEYQKELYLLRSIKRRMMRKDILLNKKKKYFFNYYNKISNLNIKILQHNLLFQWFLDKIIYWVCLLLLQSFTIVFLFIGNLNVNDISKKNNKFFLNWKNLIKEKIKNLLFFFKKNELLKSNTIDSLLIMSYSTFIDIFPKENILNLGKKNFSYNRIKSYYRLKKRNIRRKKKKEFELRYAPKIHVLSYRLMNTTRKWLKKYYRFNLYRQLNLKIKYTLSNYLHQSVLYIHHYRKFSFLRLDNTKILGDYIKFLMKYENKNPSILKKIVKIHSKQRSNCRKRSYTLMRFLHKLRNKIIFKLNLSKKKYRNYFISTGILSRNKIEKKLIISKQDRKYYIKKYVYRMYKKKLKKKYIKNRKHLFFNKNNIKSNEIKLLFNKNVHNIKIKDKQLYIKKINNLISNNSNINNILKTIKVKSSNLNLLDNLFNVWKFQFRDLSYKRYPLIGMRIECNGPTKKGRRTRTHLYNEWVDFYTLPGKMPLVTVMSDVQYWQTYGLTERAAIGIKLWMYFYSPIYSKLTRKLLNKE
jgi:hypothetical protein